MLGSLATVRGQQTQPTVPDTSRVKNPYFLLADSTIIISRDTVVFLLDTITEEAANGTKGSGSEFYEALRQSAYKSRFTRELYHLFFVSPDKLAPNDTIKTERSETPFVQYQGKTIREIRIKVLPPFGPKLYDTTLVATTWLENSANKVHHSTKKRSIRNQLHIKSGDKLDASHLADNERLIRELPYIEDAYIRVIPVVGSTRYVDLEMIVKDQFSWGVNFSTSSLKSAEFELYNKNLYGKGHELNNGFSFDSGEQQKLGYTGQYLVKNLAGSYINTAFNYQNTYEKAVVALDVFKDFETFNTKYAGGLTIGRTMRSDRISKSDPIESETPLDFNYGNIWIGRSFRLHSHNMFTRKRMVIAGRVAARKFFDRPSVGPEENKLYHNSTLYLTSLAFSKTQYYKSNLIYNFGRTEDIPYGHLMQLTLGCETREFYHRDYLGINMEKAIYLLKSRSYLFNRFAIGGFFRNSHFEQGVLLGQSKFVSRIRRLGQYRFRNFGALTYELGIRRFPEEYIDLNNGHGIRGFKSDMARGNQKLILNLETVAFSPHMIGGFRFALFSFADLGIIGSNKQLLFNQDYYGGLGFGIRLRNENLVFKTIQLRLAIYPKTPSDFRNMGFRLSGEDRPRFNNFSVGQPEVLDYR